MKRNTPSLRNKTIVITGASSGIGKAASIAFAKEKANLILAARSDTLLQELASECEALGGRATAVKTDVSDKNSLKHLFETTLSFYGKIDVWINNAGVGAIGDFEDTPFELQEQILKTNLLGPLYASYLIIPHFKERRQGIIINMNSTGAFVGHPLTAAYSASKFGLRGLSEALRYELQEYKNIHICDLFVAFVDTPALSKHSANYLGKEITSNSFFISPEKVAEIMVDLAYRPKASRHLGVLDRVARFTHALLPGTTGSLINKIESRYFKKAHKVSKTEGNLYRPDYSDNLH